MPLASLADLEKQHIFTVLEHCGGNKEAARRILKIDRRTLYRKLKRFAVAELQAQAEAPERAAGR